LYKNNILNIIQNVYNIDILRKELMNTYNKLLSDKSKKK
jgi:hypothetical protein